MKVSKYINFTSLISVFVFLTISSLLIRGSFYSAIINGISIFIFLCFYIKNRKLIDYTNFNDFLILCIPFLLVFFGFLYSDNKPKALEFILRSSPLFLIPFFYIIVNPRAAIIGYKYVEKYFPFLVLLTISVYVFLGFYISSIGLGDYLFYSNFAKILDIHPTYSGCIVNLGLFFFLKNSDSLNKFWQFLIMVVFLTFLLIIGSKTSLFIGLVISLFAFFKMKKSVVKTIILITIPLLFLIISISFLESRLVDRKLNSHEHVAYKTLINSFIKNDLKPRVLLWKSNIHSLHDLELIFGKGTSADNMERLVQYRKNNLYKAAEDNYNAHNMYIEIIYYFGIVGFLFFVLHALFLFKLIVKNKQYFYLVFLLSFYIYFLFESILIRSFGIILYTYFITYVYLKLNYFEIKNY